MNDYPFIFAVIFFLTVIVGGLVMLYLAYKKPAVTYTGANWLTEKTPYLAEAVSNSIKLPDEFYADLYSKPIFKNPTGLFMNAPRLYEVAILYRDHMLMAATDGEDLSLVDEIEQIIKDVEGDNDFDTD